MPIGLISRSGRGITIALKCQQKHEINENNNNNNNNNNSVREEKK